MSSEVVKKSHKEWRKNAKKLQRKRRRRAKAKQFQELSSKDNKIEQQNDDAEAVLLRDRIEQENLIENEKWLRYDEIVEKKWEEQRNKIEEAEKAKESERQRIKEEFLAEQKRIKELEEEKERKIREEQRQQELLLQSIDDYIAGIANLPEEFHEVANSNPGKPNCVFFEKTGTCRFGNKCSKNHSRPKIGRILLIPSFFNHIRLDQSKITEYGSDLLLEFNEDEIYREFQEFFEDAMPEFQKFGQLEQFVICDNSEPHLRGNVYVEYTNQRDALKAYRGMQGRYYACRMINIEFCNVMWKMAICGLSLKNRCAKGRRCNYLHVFKNPGQQFPLYKALHSRNASNRVDLKNTQVESSTWNDDEDEINANRHWRWSESPSRASVEKRVSEMVDNKAVSKNSSNRDRDNVASIRRSRSPSKQSSKRSLRMRSRSPSRRSNMEESRKRRSESRNLENRQTHDQRSHSRRSENRRIVQLSQSRRSQSKESQKRRRRSNTPSHSKARSTEKRKKKLKRKSHDRSSGNEERHHDRKRHKHKKSKR